MRRALTAAAFALLFLAGCASTPPAAPHDETRTQSLWVQRQAALAGVQGFKLQGRISTGALIGGSGSLNWNQRGAQFDALFSGALGVGAIRVAGDDEQLEVSTKEGRYDRAEAEALLQQRLGWTPPWSSLRWWILGLPRPGTPAAVQLDEAGRLATLDQDGWHLDYVDYRAPENQTWPLPRRIDLHRDDEKIRVVVDQWQSLAGL